MNNLYDVRLVLTTWGGEERVYNVQVSASNEVDAEEQGLAAFANELPRSYPNLNIMVKPMIDIPDVFEKYGGKKAKDAVAEVLANIEKNQKAMVELQDCLKNYSRVYYEFDEIVTEAENLSKVSLDYGVWTLQYLRKTRIQAQESAANGVICDIMICYEKMKQVIEKGGKV